MSDDNKKKILDDMLNTIREVLDPKGFTEQKHSNGLNAPSDIMPLEDYMDEPAVENLIILLLCEEDFNKSVSELQNSNLEFIPRPPIEYPCLSVLHFENFEGAYGVSATYIYRAQAAVLMNAGAGN